MYSAFLLEQIQYELEKDSSLQYNVAAGWIKELAENLAKFADTLPRDPREDSVFKQEKKENKTEKDKTESSPLNLVKIITWVLFLSPLAYSLRYLILDFLGQNFLHIYAFSFKLFIIFIIYKLLKRFIFSSDIKVEIQDFFKEISTFIKANKYKLGFSLGFSFCCPNLSRIFMWGRTVFQTGGIINVSQVNNDLKKVKDTFMES